MNRLSKFEEAFRDRVAMLCPDLYDEWYTDEQDRDIDDVDVQERKEEYQRRKDLTNNLNK